MKIRAAADVATLLATLGGEKGLELSENKIRAAKRQKRPRHALIVAGRVKKKCLRKESDTFLPASASPFFILFKRVVSVRSLIQEYWYTRRKVFIVSLEELSSQGV